jgi:prepilin-type N-terminal cleavage/methylation domain-containing protein
VGKKFRILKQRDGFSILELLVALALLSLIALALNQSLGLGIRLDERSQSSRRDLEPAVERLHLRELVAAMLPPGRDLPFEAGFSGQATSTSFFSADVPRSAHEAIAVAVEITFEGGVLSLATALIDTEGEQFEQIISELGSFEEAVEFGYFDRHSNAWLSNWGDETRRPDLVRIITAGAPTSDWPPFIVAPRLGRRE